MLSHRVMRYVDEVARRGSIRKAAAALHIAASAVNRQILALEQELGTPLFQRLPRRLQLTAAGEVLLDHIRESRRGYDRARALIDAMKGLRRGEVTVAVMSGPAGSVVPPALERFRTAHPGTRVKLQVLGGAEIVAAVRTGDADLGLAFDLPREARIRTALVHPCMLGAVMRADHPLAGEAGLRLGDCRPYPLVVADATTAIRPHLDALAGREGVTLDAAIETNSIEVMRRMAATTDAITFLTPIDILLEQAEGALTHVPLRTSIALHQQLVMITRDRAVNPLAPLLVEHVRTLLETTGAPPLAGATHDG